jgi:TonB-dependent starch-binding outer membrane protein SusC
MTRSWLALVFVIGAVSALAPREAAAQPVRALSGVVIDGDNGAGIAGATVTVKDQAALTATTADTGMFTIARVGVGDVVLLVSAPGYTPAELPVKAGRTATAIAVSLRKPPPPPEPVTRSVAGLVRDANTGKGIANATLRVSGTDITTTSDEDGVFALAGVSAADVVVEVTAEGYTPGTATAGAGDAALKLSMIPTSATPTPPVAATSRTVAGRITEQLSGEPIVGASVGIEGRETVVFTDENGEFTIDDVPLESTTFVVQSEGYQTKRITASAGTAEVLGILDFAAAAEQIVLEGRAPVIARTNLANGASVVNSRDLNRVSSQTLEGAMVGKISGANIQSNSGAPGGGMQLRLRGISTINGQSSPLYVIDGVIVSNVAIPSGVNAITAAAAGGNASNQDNPVNRIADLNPNDIESIEVLKGSSAAALYGSKAANGVVIITTKRGRAGENTVSATQRLGFAQPSNTLGSRRFATMEEAVEAYGDDAGALWSATRHDHEKELTRTALASETIVSASGGNNQGTYYGSVLMRDEPGVVTGTFYEKQTGRIGAGFDFGRVKVNLNGTVIHSLSDRGLTNNDNNGVSYYVALSSTPSFIDLRRGADGLFPANPFSASNPLQTAALFQNREDVWRFIASVNTTIDVWKDEKSDIKLLGTFGADRFSQRNDVFSPPALQYEANDGLIGTAIEGTTNNLNYNVSTGALWQFTPTSKKWKSATSLGITYEKVDLNTVYLIGQNLSQPNVDTAASLNSQENALRTIDQGIYLQEEVAALDDKLTVLLGLLAEASSLNGDDSKFYLFPKVGATYDLGVAEKDLEVARVRAAYGEAGNRPNYGQKFTPLNATNTIDGLPTLVTGGVLGEENIEPERQREIELGVDIALKDQKAVLELTGYQRSISNLLLQRQLGPSSGFLTKFENGGSLRNRGLEAALQVTPVDGDIEYTTRAILTLNRSTVTDLPGEPFNVTTVGFGAGLGAFRIEEGKSATQIVNDYDGDRDLDVVGNGEPDFRVGWLNTVSWKSLDFSALIDWQQGSEIVNLTRLLYDAGQVSPDFVANGGGRLTAFSEGDIRPYVEDASFVKLREVSIGWNAPKSWANQVGPVDSLRVTLTGRNLWTWDNYSGLDPEVSNFGNQPVGRNYDVAPYPPSRSVWFSVEVGL